MRRTRRVLFALATSDRFEEVVRGIPPAEALVRRTAMRYFAGTTRADALRVANRLGARGVAACVDYFGERVTDVRTADRVTQEYIQLASELHRAPTGTWLAVDLTHLGLGADPAGCAERLTAVAQRLPEKCRIQVGAEEAARTTAVLECVLSVAGNGLADRLGATVQANLRRSEYDLPRLVSAGVHVRLVKGAYIESSQDALPYGEPTDVAYVELAHRLAHTGSHFSLATHDVVLREALLRGLGPRPVEQLLGVRPEQLDNLLSRRIPVRVYVPYGGHWFRYWMRRVAESRGS